MKKNKNKISRKEYLKWQLNILLDEIKYNKLKKKYKNILKQEMLLKKQNIETY